jgi:hypothetical protein
MRNGVLGPVALVLAAAGLASAQAPMPSASLPPNPYPAASSGGVPSAAPVGDCHAGPPMEPGESLHGPDGNGACGPHGCVWFRGEYLLWWTKNGPVPPLVTTSPAGTPSGSAGVLGLPTTTVLVGNSNLDFDERSGARFTAGFWFDDCQKHGFEASYFFLGRRDDNFTLTSGGVPILTRPFVNALTGTEVSEITAFPGLASGNLQVLTSSRLQGAEANYLCNLCCNCCCDRGYRVDLLAGFRYLELDESIAIAESVRVSPSSPVLPGDEVHVFDKFSTHNDFYGGQLGIRGEWWWDRFFVNACAKVAIGDTHEVVVREGSTTIITPAGGTEVFPSGLLVLATNRGRVSRDEFGVVPEATLNVGYQLTPNLRAFAGYTFLYWSHVARPGDQIDRTLNVNLIPTSTTFGTPGGPARPSPEIKSTDFWAQGINVGLELRF